MSDSSYRDWVQTPAPPTLAGDYRDDDPQYIDQLFEQHAGPADESNTEKLVRILTTKPPTPGRMITGSQSWTTYQSDQISQLLPADANRKAIHLRAIGTGTDYIAFADDPNKLAYTGLSGGGFILPVGNQICLDEYTGPLWARPVGVSGTVAANNILATSAAQPTTLTGWSKQAGDSQALITAPWDATRQAYQVTAAGGATSYAICPPSVSQVQAGQTVWVRAKINASAVYSFTLRLYSSGGLSLGTVATISTLAGNNLEYGGSIVSPYTGFVRVAFVSTTNTTLGDTIAVGDCQISPAGMPLKYFDAANVDDTTYNYTAQSDGSVNAYAYGTIVAAWDAITV